MKVREVMTAPAITVAPDTAFADVVDQLLSNDISGLPVVDADGRLLGIVTEADLVSKQAYGYRRRRALGLVADYLHGRDLHWVRKGAGRTAVEVMTTAPATASPDDDLAVAARQMLESHHKRLPVIENGRVVGIVSRHDLLTPFHRADTAILADVESLLGDLLRVPETHKASPSVAAGVVSLDGTAQWPGDVALIEAVVARIPGVVAVDNRLRRAKPTRASMDGDRRGAPGDARTGTRRESASLARLRPPGLVRSPRGWDLWPYCGRVREGSTGLWNRAAKDEPKGESEVIWN